MVLPMVTNPLAICYMRSTAVNVNIEMIERAVRYVLGCSEIRLTCSDGQPRTALVASSSTMY